jgi:beta-lactamase regulating signal transducer with metallopeptidase domain
VNSTILIALTSHLLQSTLFALAASTLTLLVRKNSARVRCCLWLAASAKFLVPFAVLTALGAQVTVHRMEPFLFPSASHMATPIAQFGVEGQTALLAEAADNGGLVLTALGLLWLLGAIAVAVRWLARWMRIRRALRESMPTSLAFVIPVRSCAAQLEPAVVGILRPVLLLPKGIEERLTPEQMLAVLAHERCHVVWLDNLAAALHMLVEALFWFHPLIWWLGKRLIDERERACDEQVLADGHPPGSYAEGILRVCEHYLESHLSCVAGVGGASLRQRIEAIMNNRLIERLSGIQKLVISVAASATVAVPFAVGVLTSPQAHAQAVVSNTEEPNVSAQLRGDITTIAEAVGAATGKNFILDPRVRANVTLLSSAPMSPSAFYQAFLSILEVYGFNAEPAGDVIKIVPDANARQHPPIDLPDQATSDEFVTEVVDVKNVHAAQLVPILRPLVPPYAHLTAYLPSNILIISDRASNVNRLVRIIRRVDQVDDQDVEIIPLQNASSAEVVRVLNSLYTGAATAPEGGTPIKVVADDRSNAVLLSGDASQRLRVRALVATLDTSQQSGGHTQVRYLRYANAEKIAPTVREEITQIAQASAGASGQVPAASAQAADAMIWVDPRNNALIITAPPSTIRAVMSIIDKLDIAPPR